MPIISFPDLLQWQPVWANDGFENEIMFSHLPDSELQWISKYSFRNTPWSLGKKMLNWIEYDLLVRLFYYYYFSYYMTAFWAVNLKVKLIIKTSTNLNISSPLNTFWDPMCFSKIWGISCDISFIYIRAVKAIGQSKFSYLSVYEMISNCKA